MKRHNILRAVTALMLFIGFYACVTSNKVSVQNISESYRSDVHYLHPEYTVYHVNDSVSLVYFKLDESELLYIKRNPQDSFYASARVLCKVMTSYDSPYIVDSNSALLKFPSTDNTKKEFGVAAIPLRVRSGQNYVITATLYDLNSKRTEVTYISA